jgi:hypothetical protein
MKKRLLFAIIIYLTLIACTGNRQTTERLPVRLEVNIPTTRISAIPDTNMVYFISLDEGYCLTKPDL